MGALGVTVGIEDRAHGKARAGAPTIFGGRMQVGQRLDIGERGAHDFAHNTSSARVPSSIFAAASSRNGYAVTAPMPSATRRQMPVSSSATWAAAEANAKSLRRGLTSWKPTPMRASRQSGKRTAVMQPAAGSAVIIGPIKKSQAAISPFAVPSR
jgi:hypothetical protein